MKIEAVPFQEIPLTFMQSIAQQTSVNLVDILESKINFQSNSFKTGLNYIGINLQPKKQSD